MFKFFRNLFKRRYISVEDLVASYDPSTQQVGVAKGALDNRNMVRFLKGQRFEFNGGQGYNPFVVIPKPKKEDDE